MTLGDSTVTGDSSFEDSSSGEEDPSIYALFRDKNNRSYKFFLHKSIKRDDQRRVLKTDINRYGGKVAHSEFKTDFVLVHPTYQKKDVLQTSYNTDEDSRLHKIYVEYTTFVRRCVRDKAINITQKVKGMSGRPPGRWRNEFTFEEDERLCRYLAILMPEEEAGGRLGLSVYIRLLEMADEVPERYGWASRHTAESWKERYKKHRAEFDARIKQIVRTHPPMKKQLWPEDRRASQAKRKVFNNVLELDSDGHEIEAQEEADGERMIDEDHSAASLKRRRSERYSQHVEPAPKRSRMPSHHHSEAIHLGESGPRKGKERFPGSEEREQAEYLSMSRPPDLGTSGQLHSSEPTLIASAPTQALDNSQWTLWGTPIQDDAFNTLLSPQNEVGRDARHSQQTMQKSAFLSPFPSSNPGPGLFLDMDSPDLANSHPHPLSGRQAQDLTPPEQKTSPAPPTPPRKSQPQLNRAARRPPVIKQSVAEDSAPYRNTRSRSRSVEPTFLPVPKKSRRVKEVIPEESPDVMQHSAELPFNGETAVEEEVVEDMLVAQDMQDSINAHNVGREVSMEADDAQIALSLRPPEPLPSQIRPRQGFSSLTLRPVDMLLQLQNRNTNQSARLSLIHHAPSSGRPSAEQVGQRQASRLQRESLPFNFRIPDWDPHTPGQRSRRGSTSSLESFPASNTRASAMKKSQQLHDKQTPYKPPDGTRAAIYAQSR